MAFTTTTDQMRALERGVTTRLHHELAAYGIDTSFRVEAQHDLSSARIRIGIAWSAFVINWFIDDIDTYDRGSTEAILRDKTDEVVERIATDARIEIAEPLMLEQLNDYP